MKNLPVKYKSQWDADAGKTANDCGATSIAMILNYYGENLTTNDVFDKTGAGQGLISISQMEKAIKAFGYTTERITRSNPEKLKSFIDQGKPVIALVKYGSLNSVQDKKFKGGHFFVVVGYRADGYFVNDPNFKGSLRADGDHHFFTKSEFEKAWADAAIDGNQPNSFQVIYRKESMPEKDPLTECLAQHKKLVTEANKKDKTILGLETEVLQKETEIKGLKTSLEEVTGEKTTLESENATLSKQVAAQKGIVTTKETEIAELNKKLEEALKPQGILVGKRKLAAAAIAGLLGLTTKLISHYTGMELSVQELLSISSLPLAYVGIEGINDVALAIKGGESQQKTDVKM